MVSKTKIKNRIPLTKSGKPDKRFVAGIQAKNAKGKTPSKRTKARREKTIESGIKGYYANPVVYLVVYRSGQRVGYFSRINMKTGKPVFDTDEKQASIFLTRKTAVIVQKELIKNYDLFDGGNLFIENFNAPFEQGARKNPVPPSRAAKIKHAGALYKDFSGHEPVDILVLDKPTHDVGLIVGECAGIMYDTVRDGKEEKYIHRFRKKSRPLLYATHDGKQLGIVGGKFQFTERGICDG